MSVSYVIVVILKNSKYLYKSLTYFCLSFILNLHDNPILLLQCIHFYNNLSDLYNCYEYVSLKNSQIF